MRRRWKFLIPAIACIALAGCGTEKVSVPNVVGEQAGTAVRSIEDAKLAATLNPQPADRSLCTVKDQSETGEVEEGTEVTLHVTCQLVVPDVTDQTAAQAKAAMRAAGVSMNFEGGSPRDEATCTVVSQTQVGEVPPGTHVTLVFTCPLTLESLQSNAESLAAERLNEVDPADDYEVSRCAIISDTEGSCEVTYHYPQAGGFICTGEIVVTLNEDATVANREEQNITCG